VIAQIQSKIERVFLPAVLDHDHLGSMVGVAPTVVRTHVHPPRKSEPGIRFLDINHGLAGLGGRTTKTVFNDLLATANRKGEPGRVS
jgi:hypothetical protein